MQPKTTTKDITRTLAFEQWLWSDRWMTLEKWESLSRLDRDAYVNAFLTESAARRMVEQAYAPTVRVRSYRLSPYVLGAVVVMVGAVLLSLWMGR